MISSPRKKSKSTANISTPRNLFRYLPVSLFYHMQQQNTIYLLVFQPLTKTYFPAVSFLTPNP